MSVTPSAVQPRCANFQPWIQRSGGRLSTLPAAQCRCIYRYSKTQQSKSVSPDGLVIWSADNVLHFRQPQTTTQVARMTRHHVRLYNQHMTQRYNEYTPELQ